MHRANVGLLADAAVEFMRSNGITATPGEMRTLFTETLELARSRALGKPGLESEHPDEAMAERYVELVRAAADFATGLHALTGKEDPLEPWLVAVGYMVADGWRVIPPDNPEPTNLFDSVSHTFTEARSEARETEMRAALVRVVVAAEEWAEGGQNGADALINAIAHGREVLDHNGAPPAPVTYPHNDGDTLVIGPECFAQNDIICWRGENYERQGKLQTLTAAAISMLNATQDFSAHPDDTVRTRVDVARELLTNAIDATREK